MNKKKVLVIMGPTGVGKTKFLYEHLNNDNFIFEIVSSDSRQIYKNMKIGTALPKKEILEKIPHHLIDIIEPYETYSAGRFVEDAKLALEKIFYNGKIPIISGGTGFYFRALYTGMFAIPQKERSKEIREKVKVLSHEERIKFLKEIDPLSLTEKNEELGKGRIHPNDVYRVQRTLELYFLTGKTLRQHYIEQRSDFSEFDFYGIWIIPQKEIWLKNLYHRSVEMVKEGIIEEALEIYNKYGDCPALKTPGYKEIIEMFKEDKKSLLSQNDIIEKIYNSHKKYGKAQITWFKSEKKLLPVPFDNLLNFLKTLDFKLLGNYLTTK